MKHRKTMPATPPAANHSESSVNAAKAIAAAINQGMNGGYFCRVMSLLNSGQIKLAASYELDRLITWFEEEAESAAILRACPRWKEFAAEFHAEARRRYPAATA
jgi:hypothetical protein